MDQFLQMDIFFFITSLVALVALFFVVVIGIYAILIIQKIKLVIREFELFAKFATKTGMESVESIKEKIDEVLSQGGILERIVATALGTILAKSFARRGKIKKDVPKD
ncbi:MAG: hypothetical protein RLZZ517_135 [Candidatus Parcubacteria bacterium]|jgi:uncharacterized hydantoinase/oxoprolinase family protein